MNPATTRPDIESAWRDYLTAASWEAEKAGSWDTSGYPHFTENGKWRTLAVNALSEWRPDGTYLHGNWMAGFSIGVLWLRVLGAADDDARRTARDHLDALVPRMLDTTTHDLGFLFFPSFAFAESSGLITTAEAGPALTAARTLVLRFNEAGGYIQAFGAIGHPRSAGTSTIDTMMNLPLLWWASSRLHEPRIFDVARKHARTAARLFLREDGSSFQLNTYDPVSGALLDRGTYQGSTADSCWSRGQAWAIAGFAWSYAVTGEVEFLHAAERTLRYFSSRIDENGLVPWDFADTSDDAIPDSSASAIAALGGLILAGVHPEAEERDRLNRDALDLLASLATSALNRDREVDGILLRSSYSVPHRWGVDGAMGWGDFFYGLALAIANGAISLDSVLGQPEWLGEPRP